MSVEQNKATLLQAVARFNEPSERPAYFDLYANDAILHGYSGVEPGIDSIKQFYVAFWAAFPDASVTVAHLIGEEDYVACCFTLEGTQTGEYLGIPATGQCVSVNGVTILRFAAGHCVERWSQADSLSLLQQLGALAAR